MILVTTTGKVGTEAARLLAQMGEPVRVLAHHPENAASLLDAGVEVVGGDLAVPSTVDVALKGASGVILVSPAIPAQELNVIDSAVRAGVEHVVKITSKASVDSPIARRRDQFRIEQGLIGSGLGYTLLRNNAYMQNFLMLAPEVASAGTFRTATGDGRIGHLDARDAGAVGAEVAVRPEAHREKVYWPTGPETLSATDVATAFSKVLGRTISYDAISFEKQKEAMLRVGLPEQVADDNAKAMLLMAQGDCDYVTDDVSSILGRPPRSFEQFISDYREAFQPNPNGN
jgi:uncharacterized protein YbjT (DUF2867 family)